MNKLFNKFFWCFSAAFIFASLHYQRSFPFDTKVTFWNACFNIFFVQFQIFMANRHHCFVVSQKRCSCYVEWTQLYHTNKMICNTLESPSFRLQREIQPMLIYYLVLTWNSNISFDIIMPSNFFPPYAIEPNLFTPLSKHRRQYSQRKNVISATKKDINLQHNFKPTNNLLNKSFRSFPSQKNIFFYLLNSTQPPPTSLRKTHHSHSIHSFHSFIHSSSFTINLYIPFNQQHFVVKFHPFLNQTNNQPTSQQPNPPIHQFINSSNSSNSTTNISPFNSFFNNSFFNNILCLFWQIWFCIDQKFNKHHNKHQQILFFFFFFLV